MFPQGPFLQHINKDNISKHNTKRTQNKYKKKIYKKHATLNET